MRMYHTCGDSIAIMLYCEMYLTACCYDNAYVEVCWWYMVTDAMW